MKERHEHDQLLGQWTKYRNITPVDAEEFTRGVMDRIAASGPETIVPRQAAPRLQRLAHRTEIRRRGSRDHRRATQLPTTGMQLMKLAGEAQPTTTNVHP